MNTTTSKRKSIDSDVVTDAKQTKLRDVEIPESLPPTCKVRNRYLDKLHHHPRDHCVFFDSGENGEVHDYYADFVGDGKHFTSKNIKSVTSVIKAFFDEFDADKIIQKMMNGKNWQKSKYFGKTPEEIKQGWNQNGQNARERGTEMHDFIDCYYNGEKTLDCIEESNVELCQFKGLLRELGDDLIPYRSEWFVFTDNETKVTGAVDMTFVDNKIMKQLWNKVQFGAEHPDTLHIVIYDWKRCKKITRYNAWEKGYGPVSHMHNANFYHYSLQLNLYKWILEKFYHNVTWNGNTYKNISIDLMYLCVMHPNQKKHKLQRCPDYQEEIGEIMKLRAESVTCVENNLPELFPFDKSQPNQEEVNYDF